MTVYSALLFPCVPCIPWLNLFLTLTKLMALAK